MLKESSILQLIEYFEILYPTYYFLPEDIQNPVRLTYKSYYFQMNFANWRSTYFYFSELSLIDDQGWIMKDEKNTKIQASVSSRDEFNPYDVMNYGKEKSNSKFYKICFYAVKDFLKINRSFMKVQDFAAIVGGFLKIILFAGQLLSCTFNLVIMNNSIWGFFFKYDPSISPQTKKSQEKFMSKINLNSKINENKYKESALNYLANNNLNFEINENKSKETSSKNIAKNSLKNNYLNFETNNMNKKSQNNNEVRLNRVSKNLNYNSNQSLKFGLSNHIYYLCCSKKTNKGRQTIYNLLYSYFFTRLDITYYLKNINILEKIRLILFNSQQNLTLNFLSKPNLNCKEDVDKIKEVLNENENEQYEIVKNYFQQKLNDNRLEEIDKKLLEILVDIPSTI